MKSYKIKILSEVPENTALGVGFGVEFESDIRFSKLMSFNLEMTFSFDEFLEL